MLRRQRDARAESHMTTRATLRRKLTLLGILLCWLVGGGVGLLAWMQMTIAVRREAGARVADAVRVGKRLLAQELDRALGAGERVEILTPAQAESMPALAPALALAHKQGTANGFVRLDHGLCLVAAEAQDGVLSHLLLRPLRGANDIPDRVRDIVFGRPAPGTASPATVTIFEHDERIATNVISAHGERAVGTRASPEVTAQVLTQGRPWLDRARVLDRWVIANYEPIQGLDGSVLGMLYAGLDEEPYLRASRQQVGWFLGLIALLALLTSAGIGWVAASITRPLRELTQAATALAGGCHPSLAVAPTAPRELHVLGAAFADMSQQIAARTTELEASRAKAQQALHDYMEVLSFVAHELKSPLAGAKMQLQVITEGLVGEVPEAWRRPLASLSRAIDHGHEVAHGFNQLSRAESEGFTARRREVHDFVAEVVLLAVADTEHAASERRMPVQVQGGPMPAFVDPDLMRVALDNLIGNAIKYGREGTPVQVTVHRAPDGLHVAVQNEGVGVPREQFAQLFQKFHRVRDAATRSIKGTGVGLYLVRRLVELHGGRVGVDGDYGAWIRFWFEVP